MPDGGYMNDGPPLTVAEAAKALGYSRATLYEMIKDRKIGYVRAKGHDIRIFPRHIDDFIRRNECPALDSTNPSTSSLSARESGSGTSPGPMKYHDTAAITARALRLKGRVTRMKNQAQKPRHT